MEMPGRIYREWRDYTWTNLPPFLLGSVWPLYEPLASQTDPIWTAQLLWTYTAAHWASPVGFCFRSSSTAEYNRRKKALLARFSGKLLKGGGAAKRRARFSWRDVAGLTNMKGGSFKEVRAKMKGDYKSDPDCRQPGQTQALQEHPQAVQVRAASGNP